MAVPRHFVAVACFGGLIAVFSSVAGGADPAPAKAAASPAGKSGKPAAKAEPASAEKLSGDQEQVGESFKRLEEQLFHMGETTAASDPRRAALLKQAVEESKKRDLALQFKGTADLLRKDQVSRALENQKQIVQDLQALLQLLQSENEAKNQEAYKKQIQEYLHRINILIKQQQDVQGRTAGGGEMKGLSGEQGGLAGRTGKLATDMKATEAKKTEDKGDGKDSKDNKGDNKDGKNSKGDSKGDGKDGKNNKGDGKDSKGDGKGDGRDGKGGGKGDGKDGKGDSKESKGGGKGGSKGEGGEGGEGGQSSPSEQGQDQDQNPARKAVEDARHRMEQAQEELNKARRDKGVKEQEIAIEKLKEAQAKLEEILRQLREEEIERRLAMLEARFKKMLQMQLVVNQGTVLLDKVPKAQRTYNHQVESSRLSTKENDIIVEVDSAMRLLEEDGTALALPEAVRQLRTDMLQVAHRLAQAKTEEITQAIEKDIVVALQEIIDALKKAQDEQKSKKPSRPGLSGEPPTPPLIDTLAELKMIRALQMRINRRTERYRKLIVGEQAEQPDLVEALQRLGEHQQRIFRITRDLEMGKNQ